MRVEELMTRQIRSCSSEDSLADAARIMWEGDCGCLPVRGGDGAGHVAGMVTDRDICMAAMFHGKPLGELKVADAMNSEVKTCRQTDSAETVERIMATARIRRLPVLDAEDSLVGMITLADLAREAEREQNLQSPSIRGNEISVTLASICQPPRHELTA